MKYITLILLLLAGIAGKAQMKGDTTKSPFDQVVFLMQQNKELSDRLDRAEKRIDSLERRPVLYFDHLSPAAPSIWAHDPIDGWNIKLLQLPPY